MEPNTLPTLPDGAIISPSYKRAKKSSVRGVAPSCVFVVPESQKSAYGALHGPKSVVTVPDESDGLYGRKINACIELFKDGDTFALVDDDFLGFRHVKDRAQVKDSEAIIEAMIDFVRNSDIVFAGWSNTSDPIKVADFKPFSLTKHFFGAVVIKKTHLRHPEWPRFSDSDYFLQVVHEYRCVFRDNRYFIDANDSKDGGCESVEEQHADYSLKLLAKWGSRVVGRASTGRVKAVRSPLTGP
jgi:hypothetical protein